MAENQKKEPDLNVEIGLREGEDWSADKLAQVKTMAKKLHEQRSAKQLLMNNMRAIQYQMEIYAEMDEKRIVRPVPLGIFLQAYLNTMGISFRMFAENIGMNDANLRKYISGQRKFNADLAKKFGHFFHTSPVTWMKVYHLTELIQLRRNKVAKRYEKFDFEKVIVRGRANLVSGTAVKQPDIIKDVIIGATHWVEKKTGSGKDVLQSATRKQARVK